METTEYDFGQVVEFFSASYEERDIQQRADEILKAAARQQTVPGENHPLVDLSQCSADERTVLDRHFENKRREAQEGTQSGSESNAAISTGMVLPEAATSEAVVPYYPAAPLFIPELRHILNGNSENPPTPYELAKTVIGFTNLKRYMGSYYWQRPGEQVFRRLSEDDLRQLIFYIHEPEVAQEKSPHTIENILKMLKSDYTIQRQLTTDDRDRVFFLNGAYNMITRQLEPIRPADFFTTYVPIIFEPGQQCPVFDEFLRCVSGGDAAIISRIWEVIGYLLVPDMSAKAFFLLYGEGNTGKSVFGRLISSLFNPESLSHLTVYQFGEKFATSALLGKRLNLSMDLAKERLKREAVGIIKQITGLDTISIEEKYHDVISLLVICKLMFCSNHQLMLADMDQAFIDRIVHIPFLTPIPKEQQDPALLEKLLLERSAIVVKACDAYMRLRSNNYRFTPILHRLPVAGYVKELDLMKEFVEQCCVFGPEEFTFTVDLMNAYNMFIGPQQPQIGDTATFSRNFNAFCSNYGLKPGRCRKNGENRNGYYGVRLKNI